MIFSDWNSTSSYRRECPFKAHPINGRDEKGNSFATKRSIAGKNQSQGSQNRVGKSTKCAQVIRYFIRVSIDLWSIL